jgi:hypothetical protein
MGCLAISLWIYFGYYRVQNKTNDRYPLDASIFLVPGKVMRLAPSAGYSLLIIPLNSVYTKLAIWMNNFGKNKDI